MFLGFSHLGSVNTLTRKMESGKLKVKNWERCANIVTPLSKGLQSCKPRTDTDFEGGTTVDIERQTLSIMKACEVVGVSRRTIYNWMAGGKVQYVRTAGGSVRIFADSLWKRPQEADNSQIQH
jgi:excisionase family DNA binding protein